jgi:hypothetical protein
MGPFFDAAPGVIVQADAHEGYLGGLGFTESFVETTSFSCWSTYRDARDFAFGSGAHDEARRRDRAEQWHDGSTECFMRLRPLRSTGNLFGANPFEGRLPS